MQKSAFKATHFYSLEWQRVTRKIHLHFNIGAKFLVHMQKCTDNNTLSHPCTSLGLCFSQCQHASKMMRIHTANAQLKYCALATLHGDGKNCVFNYALARQKDHAISTSMAKETKHFTTKKHSILNNFHDARSKKILASEHSSWRNKCVVRNCTWGTHTCILNGNQEQWLTPHIRTNASFSLLHYTLGKNFFRAKTKLKFVIPLAFWN